MASSTRPRGAKVLEGVDEWELDPGAVELVESIATGSTAEVFLGKLASVRVAVKQFNQEISGMSAKSRESLCRELAILQSVNHANVVQMLGVVPYHPVQLILDLCDGGSCFELLHDDVDQEINWAQKQKMCADICEAMCYLHWFDPQIIHRDLKSLNTLLVRKWDPRAAPHVKVSDFGLSRLREASTNPFMTVAVGTCNWMAPEILTSGSYTEKVDVYSYAMILYEIVCREIPYEEMEMREVCDYVVRGGRPDLNLLPLDVPDGLVSLMQACWSQDPDDRPDFQRVRTSLDTVRKSHAEQFRVLVSI